METIIGNKKASQHGPWAFGELNKIWFEAWTLQFELMHMSASDWFYSLLDLCPTVLKPDKDKFDTLWGKLNELKESKNYWTRIEHLSIINTQIIELWPYKTNEEPIVSILYIYIYRKHKHGQILG